MVQGGLGEGLLGLTMKKRALEDEDHCLAVLSKSGRRYDCIGGNAKWQVEPSSGSTERRATASSLRTRVETRMPSFTSATSSAVLASTKVTGSTSTSRTVRR